MKRFLLEVLAFVAVQALVLLAVERTYDRLLETEHYMAALEDKERLLQSVRPPRVVLVGGSSMAFGVNSRAIERSLGLPVVNVALHAGLGLDMILGHAERGLRAGDRVVVSPEYRLLEKGLPFDSATVWHEIAARPWSVRDVSPRSVPSLLDDGLVLPRQRLVALWDRARQGPIPLLYKRSSFDERGDFVGHLEFGSMNGSDQHVFIRPADSLEDACARLSRFAARAREQGAEVVVVVPPPIPNDDLEAQRSAATRLWSRLSGCTGLPVTDVVPYDRSLFFDTAYHLTREGRRVHTPQVVRAVKKAPHPDAVASEH